MWIKKLCDWVLQEKRNLLRDFLSCQLLTIKAIMSSKQFYNF